MSILRTCQMSIFGNYEGIVPESELVLRLAEALKEYGFIPGTIDVGLFDETKGEASIGKRIHMISNDECWTINIMIERIDFKYSYKKGTIEYSRIENVCETAAKLAQCVFGVLEDVRGRRLGLYCSVGYDLTDSNIRKIITENTFGLSQFAERNVKMQLVRLANIDIVEFGDGKREKSNVVLNVNIDTRENKNKLLVTCDVNTVSDSKQMRFIPKDFGAYAAAAQEKIHEMLSDFQAYIER